MKTRGRQTENTKEECKDGAKNNSGEKGKEKQIKGEREEKLKKY